MNFWGTFRIIVGTLAGGALGFKVMHIAEENYKEKIRADIANLPEEKGRPHCKMLLHFSDPAKLKTRKVTFEETYYARDSGTLEQLKELSSKRKAVEESINGISNITAAIAREMAGGVTSPVLQDIQRVERYLPHLQNLVMRVSDLQENQQIVQWTRDLNIRWISRLSGFSGIGLAGPKYHRVDDIRYELSMMLSLYAALLRERALELLPADLVESAALFRRAAGVYQYLAEHVLPDLQSVPSADRPPEATVSMASAMSLISLAEAQAVTVRKAEEKGTSGGLLGKLHYGVVQILEEVDILLQSSPSDWVDVSDRLRRYVTLCSSLHETRSQVYIAHELKQQEQLGVAVGILRHAMDRMQLHKTPDEDDWRTVFRQEVDTLAELLRKFEHENDFVWREKVPLRDELPILEGKRIVTPIVYLPSGLDREFVFVT